MPGGDRTGPMGVGPMTGRRAGFCSGLGQPGYMSQGGGGRGFAFGGGRGRRNRFFAGGRGVGARWWGGAPLAASNVAPTPEQEKQMLQQQVQELQGSLTAIQNRLNELDDNNS